MENQEYHNYKCILVGDGGVGKTTFIKNGQTALQQPQCISTSISNIYPLIFKTCRGPCQFDVWDSTVKGKFGDLQENFYAGAQCAIIIFDLMQETTYIDVRNWYNDISSACPNIPITVCGSKADLVTDVMKYNISFDKSMTVGYYSVSGEANYNFYRPFLWMARNLLRDPDLMFLELPSCLLRDIYLDKVLDRKVEEVLNKHITNAVAGILAIFSDDWPTFKCVVVGDSGIGKTTFINSAMNDLHQQHTSFTSHVGIYHLVFGTNKGAPIKFNVWDPIGQKVSGDMPQDFYANAQAAIIMFDLTNEATFDNVPNWYRELITACPNITIALCGNKADVGTRKTTPQSVVFTADKGVEYNNVSSKLSYNLEKPFLALARNLLNDADLQFVALPPLPAPENIPPLPDDTENIPPLPDDTENNTKQ